MKFCVKKRILRQKQRLVKYWHRYSKEWHWLSDPPLEIPEINRRLWQASVPSLAFYFLLLLSGVISTLGLLANSVAVIIGAMIIAPLMGPIIGIAYAVVVANRRLLKRSIITVSTGTFLTIFVSFITTYLLGLRSISSEILARTNPSLLDLGVAIAAGAAGSFANSRRRIANALPGVAIAVALVPPLSVIGIGLALGKSEVSTGAIVLFLTNLIGMVFSGSVVFLTQRYGSIKKARHGLVISLLTLSFLALPLGFSLEKLLVKENVRRSVEVLVRRRTVTFSRTDIRSLRVLPEGKGWFVELEVAASLDSISQKQVGLVRDFLQRELEKPVNLKVRVIPVDVLEAPR
ncbi:MAG: TIGR00341 family protein, partial [Okeania sp. SIO2D1]|nr:TIGR00341 family protein [Okeania sp. SIO2D1]